MTFKSKIGWPETGFKPPTRHGTSQGHSTENRMLQRMGGEDTIRKDYVTNPDGSVTMGHTRGQLAQPEFITSPIDKVSLLERGRTFVFTLIGGKAATIANRHLLTSTFDIIKQNATVARARYYVTTTKLASLIATTWNDVWRLDGTQLSVNGKAPKVSKTTSVADRGKSVLPFVLLNNGAYDPYSPVFVGYSSVGYRGVFANSKAVEVAPEHAEFYERRSSAGVSVTDTGAFKFIGGAIALNAQGGSAKQAASLWSVIQSSSAPPYLTRVAHGASVWNLGAATACDTAMVSSTEPFSLTNTDFLTGYFIFDTVITRGSGEKAASYDVAFVSNQGVTFPHDARQFSGTQTRAVATASDATTLSAYTGSGVAMNHSASLSGSTTAINGTGYEKQYSTIETHGPEGNNYPGTWYFGLPTMASLQNQEPWITWWFHRHPIKDYHVYKPTAFTGSLTQYSSHLSTLSELSSSGLKSPYRTGTQIDYEYLRGWGTYATKVDDSSAYPDSWGGFGNTEAEIPSGDYLSNLIGDEIKWYCGTGDLVTESEYRDTTVSTFVITHAASTVDYVYADIAEEVCLTFESELSYVYIETNGTMSHHYSLTVRYVLSVRGAEYALPVYSGSSFTNPLVRLSNALPAYRDVRGESTNPLGAYHQGYVGTPIFSPPFMAQGNCPYIAYTTKAEELAGANPEFYMDFNLLPCQHTDIPNADDADLYTGTTRFCPHQFLIVYRKYLGGEDPTTFMLTRNQNLWGQLFPRAQRFQFANGVIGPWQSALGDPFSGNQPIEISRT